MTDEDLDELITPIAEQLTLREFLELMEVAMRLGTEGSVAVNQVDPLLFKVLVSKGILALVRLDGSDQPVVQLTDMGVHVLSEADLLMFAAEYSWTYLKPRLTERRESPVRWLFEQSPASLKAENPSEARARKFAEQRKAASFRKGFSRR